MGLERFHSEVIDNESSGLDCIIPLLITLLLLVCSCICGILLWLHPEWLVNLCHNL